MAFGPPRPGVQNRATYCGYVDPGIILVPRGGPKRNAGKGAVQSDRLILYLTAVA